MDVSRNTFNLFLIKNFTGLYSCVAASFFVVVCEHVCVVLAGDLGVFREPGHHVVSFLPAHFVVLPRPGPCLPMATLLDLCPDPTRQLSSAGVSLTVFKIQMMH